MNAVKHHLIVNGQEVAYYQLGNGKPLLFLHGGRVEARTFMKLLKDLAKDHLVIAPDLPGHGSSDTPKEIWSFVEYAHFFDAFLGQVRCSNVTVVGYSMGGGIALNLTAQSSLVSKLVLIDSSGLRLSNTHSHKDARRLLFYCTHPQFFAAFFTLARDFTAYSWKHRRDRKHMQRIRERCSTTQYDDAFAHINIPTTILWGADDWIYPAAYADEFQRMIPHAKLMFVPGNHDWLVYNPLLYRRQTL